MTTIKTKQTTIPFSLTQYKTKMKFDYDYPNSNDRSNSVVLPTSLYYGTTYYTNRSVSVCGAVGEHRHSSPSATPTRGKLEGDWRWRQKLAVQSPSILLPYCNRFSAIPYPYQSPRFFYHYRNRNNIIFFMISCLLSTYGSLLFLHN